MDYLVRCRYALVACLSVMSVIPVANAQTYSRTEVIEYHDDLATYVLGQVKKTTCAVSAPAHDACDGQADSVISQVDYGWKAMPSKTYSFGKPQETFSYETAVAGQLGTLKTIADGNNNVTTLSSWKRGIPQSIKYPATPEAPSGATQTAVVDDNGWIRSINDEMNSKTCYDHDLMGRVKKITYPSETQANVCNTSKWAETTIDFSGGHAGTYGLPTGHWRRTMLTGNGRKIVFYDALWRPVVEQTLDLGDPNNTVSAAFIRYDAAGRPSFRSYSTRVHGTTSYLDQTLKGTHTVYDALDRVTQVRQDWEGTGQLTTTTEYLAGFQTRVTNPRNHQTLTTLYQTFDEPSYDLPRGINHPEGAFTEIHRDIFGKVTALKRRNANGSVALTRSYAYNVNQELCRSVEPETGATVMGYDGAGNLTWSAAGLPASTACHTTGNTTTINARKAARTYDGRNRLTALTFADGQGNQAWTYAADGVPEKIVTSQPKVVPVENIYVYNRRRLLASETTKITGSLFQHQYTYNANGHMATMVYGSGLSVDFAPNALGQPTKAGTFASAATYHPNGALKSFTYGNGIQHTLTQNVRGLPDTSCDFYGTCTASAFVNDGYDYDPNGNVAAISDGRTGNRGHRTMAYDGLDRLTSVTVPVPTSSFFGNATYAYDVLDNLTRVQVTGGNQPRNHYYCYDAQGRLAFARTGSVCTGTASPAAIALTYDPQGNVLAKNADGYEFDLGNRLRRSVSKEWYAYDGHGRRVLSCTPTACDYQQYGLNGKLYWHRDNRAAKQFDNIYLGGSLVAIRDQPAAGGTVSVRYQHTDALGSPVIVTNASRGIVERSEYEPYGWPANRAWRDGPGYTGHVEDAATKLTYMRQRYYDPQLGVFLSADPVTAHSGPVKQFHRYRYANNNPYRFTDPNGRIASEKKEEPPPEPKPQEEETEPTSLGTVVVVGVRPAPTPVSTPTPWSTVAGGVGKRLVGPLALFWPSPMGASPCEMPGGPPCGMMMSGSFPPGFWPGDSGAAEWGRRNGVGAKEGKDRFHRGVKEHTPGARGDHDFGVNPQTGEVVDQNGEPVGNLNDE
ncbi:RHS repeat domain-containing protein [Luteimonas saliphila]|uniref:RHS repeat domain-containing protein n=1 Tax=Luteimonas saliphila TaxID=2804919 RepID=UPI001EE23F9B|nr:RHS repeat-associated core domain-containing protein [Luteimonas saliphila]